MTHCFGSPWTPFLVLIRAPNLLFFIFDFFRTLRFARFWTLISFYWSLHFLFSGKHPFGGRCWSWNNWFKILFQLYYHKKKRLVSTLDSSIAASVSDTYTRCSGPVTLKLHTYVWYIVREELNACVSNSHQDETARGTSDTLWHTALRQPNKGIHRWRAENQRWKVRLQTECVLTAGKDVKKSSGSPRLRIFL